MPTVVIVYRCRALLMINRVGRQPGLMALLRPDGLPSDPFGQETMRWLGRNMGHV